MESEGSEGSFQTALEIRRRNSSAASIGSAGSGEVTSCLKGGWCTVWLLGASAVLCFLVCRCQTACWAHRSEWQQAADFSAAHCLKA